VPLYIHKNSILEGLIVVVILGIIVAIAVPNLMKHRTHRYSCCDKTFGQCPMVEK
jgi:competence protein ComGC